MSVQLIKFAGKGMFFDVGIEIPQVEVGGF
jgi:hypothetical protein